MAVGRVVRGGTGIGQCDRFELGRERLGHDVQRVAGAVDVPDQMGDVITLGVRFAEHRVLEHEGDGQLGDLVVPQGGEIDRLPVSTGVRLVGQGQVAQWFHAVARAQGGQIHVRVTDVGQLEIDQGRQLALIVKELGGVPGDERGTGAVSRECSVGARLGETRSADHAAQTER